MTSTEETQALLPVTLKPCPFCGGSDVVPVCVYHPNGYAIGCVDCRAKGPLYRTANAADLPAEAITAWNTRISHSLPGDAPLANELRDAFPAGEKLGVRLSAHMFGRILAALTPSPCPGDGMREAREAFFDLIADARKWEEVHDEEAIYYTLETTHASLIPLMNALGIEQQYQPIEGDGESFPGYESPAEAIDRAMGRAALTPSATISDATKRMEQTLGAKFQATPSALSGDAGEGELRAALAKRTSMSTIAGGGKRPHIEIRFADVTDAHALTDAILNRSNKEGDHGPRS